MVKKYMVSGRTPSTRSRSGFALIETVIAMAILFIAMASIVTALISSMRLREINENSARVRNVAEEVFNAMRGMTSIPDAYNRFGGGGTQETFDVRGLQGPAANVPPGRIIVWRDKDSLQNRVNPPQPDPGSALALTQNEILEAQMSFSDSFPAVMNTVANAAGTAWTDYLDTNGDGFVDAADEPQLMPVTVRLQWRSPTGTNTRFFSALIGQR